MLRIFHTADWHLGQVFHGYDRDYEHARFFDWLLEMIAAREPDALLVAGDVFDSVNPSAAAQRRLYDFLSRAHEIRPALQVVLTAGNHDAAGRLEAPADVLRRLKISVIGTVARNPDGTHAHERFLVPLRDRHGAVRALVLAVPFLRPSDVPALADCADPYLDGIREFYRCVVEKAEAIRDRDYPGAVLIALGHCHMHDCAESRDSERRVVIGGAESLRADTFPPCLAYVGLGHLHKAQELDGGRIRYSGSPIPLSFSEVSYEHGITEVSVADDGAVSCEVLPAPRRTLLLRLPADGPAPLSSLLPLLAEYPFPPAVEPEAHPFLEVRVLDEGPDPTRRREIERVLENKPVRLASIKTELPVALSATPATDDEPEAALEDLRDLDPEAIMIAAHLEQHQCEPDPALLAALREILTAEGAQEREPA